MDYIIIFLSLIQTFLTGFFVYTYCSHISEFNRIRKWSNRFVMIFGGISLGIISIENIYNECKKKITGLEYQITNNIKKDLDLFNISPSHNNLKNLQNEINNLKSLYKNNTETNKTNENIIFKNQGINTTSY